MVFHRVRDRPFALPCLTIVQVVRRNNVTRLRDSLSIPRPRWHVCREEYRARVFQIRLRDANVREGNSRHVEANPSFGVTVDRPNRSEEVFAFSKDGCVVIFHHSAVVSRLVVRAHRLVINVRVRTINSRCFAVALFDFHCPSRVSHVPNGNVRYVRVIHVRLRTVEGALVNLLVTWRPLVHLPSYQRYDVVN